MKIDKSEINLFWNQFELISQRISDSPNDKKLIKELAEMVCGLGDFDWEYGPSDVSDFYFCISYEANEELVEVVDRIIALAPRIDKWEILAGKPKKREILDKFNLINHKGQEITVETELWECVIYKFPDNTFDLDVKVLGVNGDDDTKYLALEIHLINLIGERNYMKSIGAINIVSQFSEEVKERTVLLKNISNYLN